MNSIKKGDAFMKSTILEIINNKKKLILLILGFILIAGLIIVGNSYAFIDSELDLNASSGVEVGDVVKLRKYILNGYKTFTVELNIPDNILSDTGFYFDSPSSIETVVESTDARFYLVPNNQLFEINLQCTNNQTATYENYVVIVHNVTASTTCTLSYIGKQESLNKQILGNGKIATYIDNGVPDYSTYADSSTYILVNDDYGTSYVARSHGDNIKFAGFDWQIIRINGDGSIRIMLDTSLSELSGAFNTNGNAGYMYTAGELHGNSISSNAKTILDKWYEDNLLKYSAYISDGIFCNDRTIYNGTVANVSYNGDGLTLSSAYGSAGRIIKSTAFAKIGTGPSLICSNKNDAFTVSDTVHGNAKLKYPIGLITADEMTIKGSSINTPSDSSQNFWTMSPYIFNGSTAQMFSGYSYYTYYYMISGGTSSTLATYYFRPVINLKKDIIVNGPGADEQYYNNYVVVTK